MLISGLRRARTAAVETRMRAHVADPDHDRLDALLALPLLRPRAGLATELRALRGCPQHERVGFKLAAAIEDDHFRPHRRRSQVAGPCLRAAFAKIDTR